jgi:[ribosomal protein S5]-alanine N-acetyltransferase
VILETERLVLREGTESDADVAFLLELLNSRGFIEGIADRGVRTMEQSRAYMRERLMGSYAEHGFGMWIVTRKGETTPIGLAGLVCRDILPHVDVGYAFLESAWGKGYAEEAARGVLRYAQGPLGLGTICAIINPSNLASRRVLEKIGLRSVDTRELSGWNEPSGYFET